MIFFKPQRERLLDELHGKDRRAVQRRTALRPLRAANLHPQMRQNLRLPLRLLPVHTRVHNAGHLPAGHAHLQIRLGVLHQVLGLPRRVPLVPRLLLFAHLRHRTPAQARIPLVLPPGQRLPEPLRQEPHRLDKPNVRNARPSLDQQDPLSDRRLTGLQGLLAQGVPASGVPR